MNEQEKIEKLINESGNSFHFRVVELLRSKGWKVLISPYYTDNMSDKPREIDIIAEKLIPIISPWGSNCGNILIRLFVECKYITNPSVFWFDKVDEPKLAEKLFHDEQLEGDVSYQAIKVFRPNHHYLKTDEVAKLFSASNNATEQDIIYKAVNQCLNSLIYYRNKCRDNRSILFTGERIDHTLNFPVVACNSFSNFYNANDKSKINNDFLLEINYAYRSFDGQGHEEYFVVDVVDSGGIEKWLIEVENDGKKNIEQILYFREKSSSMMSTTDRIGELLL